MPQTRRETEVLKTGCVRQKTGGRGAYELFSPFALERDAKLMEWGANHRGHRNWEKGCPYSRCVQSLRRHLNEFILRRPDEDHGDHLAAIRFWAGALIHYEEMIKRGGLPPELDDLPHYEHQEFPCPSSIPSNMKPTREKATPLRIYVAGPISNTNSTVVKKNFEFGAALGRRLEKKGHLVFTPHNYQVFNVDPDYYEYLLRLDLSIIKRWANAMFFIGPSPGADRELALAKECGHLIFYTESEVPILQTSSVAEPVRT